MRAYSIAVARKNYRASEAHACRGIRSVPGTFPDLYFSIRATLSDDTARTTLAVSLPVASKLDYCKLQLSPARAPAECKTTWREWSTSATDQTY